MAVPITSKRTGNSVEDAQNRAVLPVTGEHEAGESSGGQPEYKASPDQFGFVFSAACRPPTRPVQIGAMEDFWDGEP